MATIKLTKRSIDAIPTPATDKVFYWDTELQCFGLRVTAKSKAFVVQTRVDGKTVRVTLGKYGVLTAEQAREKARIELGKLASGINTNIEKRQVAREAITLQQAFEEYIAQREFKSNTIRDYTRAMNSAFHDWKDKPVISISRSMIQKRFDELSTPKVGEDGELLAKNKAFPNLAFRFLRALLNWTSEKYANEDGEPLLPSNPTAVLNTRKAWHKVDRREDWIRLDQLKAFFRELQHQPYHTDRQKKVRDLCALFVLTGLRLNEGASLRWQDVDLERKVITVPAERAKNHKKHELPIGNWLASLLGRYTQANAALPEDARSEYVFSSTNRVGYLKDFHPVIREISKQAGVDFTPHDLRRTFITIVNSQIKGLSAYTIKRLLNHAIDSNDVTAGYIINDVESLREPMQQLEDILIQYIDHPYDIS